MKHGFVADASVAAAWFVESQSTSDTDALLAEAEHGFSIHVPVLWAYELANVLLILKRRGRIDQQGYDQARRDVRALNPVIDIESAQIAFDSACDLAQKYDLSLYDAVYLELALRTGLPLASRDSALNKAAKRAGVHTLV